MAHSRPTGYFPHAESGNPFAFNEFDARIEDDLQQIAGRIHTTSYPENRYLSTQVDSVKKKNDIKS